MCWEQEQWMTDKTHRVPFLQKQKTTAADFIYVKLNYLPKLTTVE